AWPVSFLAVGIQGELGNQKQTSSHIRQGQVRLAIFIFKDPHSAQHFYHLVRGLFCVFLSYTDQDHISLSNTSDDFSINGYRALKNSLNYKCHLFHSFFSAIYLTVFLSVLQEIPCISAINKIY